MQDYKGQCVLEVSQGSISVKVAPCLDLTTENRDLGTWPLDCIRRFNTQVSQRNQISVKVMFSHARLEVFLCSPLDEGVPEESEITSSRCQMRILSTFSKY